MTKFTAISALLCITVGLGSAHAVVPGLIPVQGVLTDDQGIPIDESQDMDFAIYDSETGGAALWSESQVGVIVSNGFFTAYLGDATPIDPLDLTGADALWLEVTVEGEALSRVRLAAVPFAFECLQVGDLSETDIQPMLSGANACPADQCLKGWNDTAGQPICATSPAGPEGPEGPQGPQGLEGPQGPDFPNGSVMMFDLTECPEGWTALSDAAGRTIVGLGDGGALKGTVGTALGNIENRTHTHNVNPANTATDLEDNHRHGVDPPEQGTHYTQHSHIWSRYSAGDWYSFNSSNSQIRMFDWSNGIDNSGEGYYPMASTSSGTYYYTNETAHNHPVNIASFLSGNAGGHLHSVDIANTTSTAASTSSVMPYIQLLICRKD